MAPKTKGENTKKAAGNAKKAEAAAGKAAVQDAKKAKEEDKEWAKGAKDDSKKYILPVPLMPCHPFSTQATPSSPLTPPPQSRRRRQSRRSRTKKGRERRPPKRRRSLPTLETQGRGCQNCNQKVWSSIPRPRSFSPRRRLPHLQPQQTGLLPQRLWHRQRPRPALPDLLLRSRENRRAS